ncbi:FKBP-type peptidyl-prolyl cis-trans isomerase [Actinotalea sp. C106]|uniref:FKBP-type peptidyl-prolyl cis-trans isomerase n=1 Tax=Actinotalea sp. C106 TaxID=2908644 RepID=UPI002028C804|nr:FKBP-type peptidyl-prolyl cis-trans isomerase [Actinotalea sp. C106]
MRRRAGALATVLMVVVLGACASESEPSVDVVVTGESGEVPELAYEMPLVIEEAMTEVVWEGQGPAVVEGEPVLVNFYAEDGAEGTVLGETFSSDPKPYLLSPDALGVDIYEALEGRTVGSRILHMVPGDASTPPTVAVFDLLPTRAEGEQVEAREGLPTVELAGTGEPSITIPDVEPPGDLVVQPLQRGSGDQVAPGQVVTVQYTGVAWSDGAVFDTTWAPGKLPATFPIGVGSVIAAWDEGLVEQTVGSQVLLVAPPAMGYGGDETELSEETLVFVVDILAATGGPSS